MNSDVDDGCCFEDGRFQPVVQVALFGSAAAWAGATPNNDVAAVFAVQLPRIAPVRVGTDTMFRMTVYRFVTDHVVAHRKVG